MTYTQLGTIGVCILSDNAWSFSNSNPCALMTLNNIVMFCDDVEITNYNANSILLTLPQSAMFPLTNAHFIVPVTDNSLNPAQTRTTIAKVKTDGTVILLESFTDAIVHLNGSCYHANSKYYTPAIGNIYNKRTSPLRS